jgi:hypothetical protein
MVSVTPRPRFTPRERTPGTHCTGGWVGPRAGLDTEDREPFKAHACHMPRPPHSPWLDLPNDIWGWVQIMKFLVVQLPPFPWHLIPFRSLISLILPTTVNHNTGKSTIRVFFRIKMNITGYRTTHTFLRRVFKRSYSTKTQGYINCRNDWNINPLKPNLV